MEPRPPFWQEDGTETCAECTHRYHLVVERRCAGCDRGVCEHCAVQLWETHEVLCVPCAEEES